MCDLLEAYTCGEFNVIAHQSAKTFLDSPINDSDIVLLDLKMPDMDGVEVIRELADINKNCSLLIMSGCDEGVLHSSMQLAKGYGLNIITYLTKPIKFPYLINLLVNLKEKNNKNTLLTHSIVPNDHLFYNFQPSRKYSSSNAIDFKPTLAELVEALKQQHFILYYQPQISLAQKKIIGVEALIRWHHPEYGVIFPDQFIPLAEQSGVIEQLTERVINLAIAQLKLWNQQALVLKISINISAQNITSFALPDQLTRLVNENEVDPAMLMLEITESALMTELTTSLNILTRLRLKGFKLSIDDFGTGYSSLSQLHRVPFTELKIDREFVSGMLKNVESKAIVDTCILLGHNLNMAVIAEGVEEQETLDLLQQMGCDNAQGYVISKPLPIAKL
jgi:EAL domain-containing protein (putative c-di-GMP-specific phosphodiesterase class I)